VPSVVASVVVWLLYAYLVLMFVRLIMGYVLMFNRSYRPTGFVAVLLELTYTVTDPPVKALRRVLPPLRIGSVSIDLGFILVFIVVRILIDQIAQYR